MNGKTALIAGSSGLVGNELLNLLLEGNDYSHIYSIVRKPLGHSHPKLTEIVVNFDKLEDYHEFFAVDNVFCCLGTTIKKAKSKEAMYKVDVEYPVSIARLAFRNGAKQFSIISSMGANPHSANFYLNMKGRLENEISELPFQTISIFQPTLLLGDRQEFRLGEKLGGIILRGFSFLLIGPLRKYRAIKGETVALAIYKLAQDKQRGVTIYPSEKIRWFAH